MLNVFSSGSSTRLGFREKRNPALSSETLLHQMCETAATQRNGTHCLSVLLVKMEGRESEIIILVTFYINNQQKTTHCSWQLTYGREKTEKACQSVFHLSLDSSFLPWPLPFLSGAFTQSKENLEIPGWLRYLQAIRKQEQTAWWWRQRKWGAASERKQTNKKVEFCGRLRTKVLEKRTDWVMAPLEKILRVHKSRKYFFLYWTGRQWKRIKCEKQDKELRNCQGKNPQKRRNVRAIEFHILRKAYLLWYQEGEGLYAVIQDRWKFKSETKPGRKTKLNWKRKW